MVNKALILKNISKKYNKDFAIENLSLELEEGVIAGIVGPNGAGKSTLLKIISGFLQVDSGEVLYFGERKGFYQIMDTVSYLPERLELYGNFYVSEIACFFGGFKFAEKNPLFSTLGLDSVANKKFKHLSKGYKQRLKLYIALSDNKKIVLLDEPFDGFDPIQLKEMIKLVKEENKRGKTFILSLHHLYHAEKICNYFVLLKEGKIISEGSLEEFRQKWNDNSLTLEDVFERELS